MIKYLAALACGSLLACGTGPEEGSPIGPSVQEQRIASNGQRIPPVDQQSIGVVDPQAIPGGGGVNIPPGEEGCEQFCTPFREAECELDNCEVMCAALRAVTGACAETLLQYARCFVSATDDCEAAQGECVMTYAETLQSVCAGQLAQFQNMVDVEVER